MSLHALARQSRVAVASALAAAILTACGGGATGPDETTTVPPVVTPPVVTPSSYTVSGTATGLSGSIVLQNNSGDDLTIAADGTFQFATTVANGGAYSVTVKNYPTLQKCSIANSQGPVSANVTNVELSCSSGTLYVSTFAGTGANGAQDGVGTAALFGRLLGIKASSDGNLYVADTGNNRIRKISLGGTVSTLTTNSDSPGGLTLVGDDVYTGSLTGRRIQKTSPDGVVSTFSGTGVTGGADGPASSASFRTPTGLAHDSQGNIYVADYISHTVRKVASDGSVTTFAGTGTAGYLDATSTAAQFNGPFALAVGPDDYVYVADSSNNRIRKISPAGEVTTLAGTGTAGSVDGSALSASFAFPTGIAVDRDGVIFVSDGDNKKIRAISKSNVVSTIAGNGSVGYADGPAASATFGASLRDIAFGDDGALYVTDELSYRIRKISAQ